MLTIVLPARHHRRARAGRRARGGHGGARSQRLHRGAQRDIGHRRQLRELSRFAAGIERLDGFSRQLDGEDRREANRAEPGRESNRCRRRLGPDARAGHPADARRRTLVLVRDLSLTIEPGRPDGASPAVAAKSLPRAIVGLWDAGSGRSCARTRRSMFLPQPTCCWVPAASCSTRSASAVSDRDSCWNCSSASTCPTWLERCGGLDAELDWEKDAVHGRAAAAGFARLLLTRPRYAILDEATSALDLANERRLSISSWLMATRP